MWTPFGGHGLLYPDPIPLTKELKSWHRTAEELGSLSEPLRQAFVDRYLPEALGHPSENIRSDVQAVLAEGQLATVLRMAMLGAVASNDTAVFVKRRTEDRCYELARDVWRKPNTIIANLVAMAAHGRFTIVREFLPHASLEVEVAGGDLFLRATDFRKLTRFGAGSEAERKKAAKDMVAALQVKHPDRKLTNREFLDLMRPRFPGASDASLLAAFASAKLPAWRKGGRPLGRRS